MYTETVRGQLITPRTPTILYLSSNWEVVTNTMAEPVKKPTPNPNGDGQPQQPQM